MNLILPTSLYHHPRIIQLEPSAELARFLARVEAAHREMHAASSPVLRVDRV
jgi:hypothetical protein